MATADVSHLGSRVQFGHDSFERRQPPAHQMSVVTRPEEPFATLVGVMEMFVPTKAGAAPGGGFDLRGVEDRPDGDLEEAR